jgi:hypothetical protein
MQDDSPCQDLYTSMTVRYEDHFLLFPSVFYHFPFGDAPMYTNGTGKGNDGVLEVWCSVLNRILQLPLLLGFTMLLGLKPGHTCDPITHLSGVHCLLLLPKHCEGPTRSIARRAGMDGVANHELLPRPAERAEGPTRSIARWAGIRVRCRCSFVGSRFGSRYDGGTRMMFIAAHCAPASRPLGWLPASSGC